MPTRIEEVSALAGALSDSRRPGLLLSKGSAAATSMTASALPALASVAIPFLIEPLHGKCQENLII
jgi:hypothetical protein